ncbi:hypothetical protein HZY62_21170 [Maribacter polysiphoniae]|uniref:Lipoprotein n=1 Tax=Maribacter polysiphoniae TaxID=429344 RepID=A0A316DGG6_9FLAO|nr:hypothetical protein [Maribacter polysiphoniae]MBD1263114.1 hypothetical protein [Maribacter polysiphoniae]PWK16995.1 hypothetical protein LX92_04479 [Maribacter polysiphoniae]
MAKLSKILALFFFSTILSPTCYGKGNPELKKIETDSLALKLSKFEKASEFFFSTLQDNFGGSDQDNLIQLMDILIALNLDGDHDYKIQVNQMEFDSLNTNFESVYDDYFPVYIYKYSEDSSRKYEKANMIIGKERDTVEVSLPTDINCPYIKNSIYQGALNYGFYELLLKIDSKEPIQKEITHYLNATGSYSALELSYTLRKAYSDTELGNLVKIKSNRILISLVFWEYLSNCANYDLSRRKNYYVKE